MRRLLPATLLASMAIAATAAAQGTTTTATPNNAGKGTKIHTELDATQPPVSGRIPKETVLSIQKGYVFTPKAVAKRCSEAQANEDKCPAKSSVGTAQIQAVYMSYPVTIPVRLYLAKPTTPGDLAGLVAEATLLNQTTPGFGRIVASTSETYGISVILPTPGGDAAASFGATFKSFSADLGASRVVKTKVKRKGKKPKVKKTRYDLIKNPAVCDPAVGTWAANAVFTFADDTTAEVLSTIACAP